MLMLDRRRFLQRTCAASAALSVWPLLRAQETAQKPAPPPALSAELVREFVKVGHGELVPVQRMLAEHPTLLNAAWDWGGGDFEMAIEGAGHVGSVEVAEYLLAQGARANIFVLTMLGHTAVVKGLLGAYPHLLRSKGPHGLTLVHHATRGGEPARELLEHIQGLGLTEMKFTLP